MRNHPSPNGHQKPIVVLGASGQVGKALLQLLGDQGVGLTRAQADLSRLPETLQALEKLDPAALINAAAYTQVDQAESHPELAQKINAEVPGALAHWAKQHRIPLVHYSTDYVFSGEGTQPWTESDLTAPLNTYGRTKLDGERRIIESGGDFLILRTSWVYDAHGSNFLNAMLRLGAERDTLRIVNDQVGAPTYAKDIAQATLKALEQAQGVSPFPSGIYHLTNSGETSWHGFATKIFEIAKSRHYALKIQKIESIPSSEYPSPAIRPKNSRLSTRKFQDIFGFKLRSWDEALLECMQGMPARKTEK